MRAMDIAGIVVLVLVLGAGGYFLFAKKNGKGAPAGAANPRLPANPAQPPYAPPQPPKPGNQGGKAADNIFTFLGGLVGGTKDVLLAGMKA